MGNINEKIETLTKNINHILVEYKVSEQFHDFINSNDNFIIIPEFEFSGIDLNIICCQTLDNVQVCDFCKIKYSPNEICFHECEYCSVKWCYFDGRYADYYCEKNKRMWTLKYISS